MKNPLQKVQVLYKANREEWKRLRRATMLLVVHSRILCLLTLVLFPIGITWNFLRGAYYYVEELLVILLGLIHPSLALKFLGEIRNVRSETKKILQSDTNDGTGDDEGKDA